MKKRCRCGHAMIVDLRTVIFSNKVEIENVPVYSCPSCTRSEVCTEVKPELTNLLSTLTQQTTKRSIPFQDINEFSYVIHKVHQTRCGTNSFAVQQIIDERINDLLDLMIIARSVNDAEWVDKLMNRLNQITALRHIPQEMMKKQTS